MMQDEHTRLTALRWLKSFVEMGPSHLVEQYPAVLGAILANISAANKDIQQVWGLGMGGGVRGECGDVGATIHPYVQHISPPLSGHPNHRLGIPTLFPTSALSTLPTHSHTHYLPPHAQAASDTNKGLLGLTASAWRSVDTTAVLGAVVGRELRSDQERTRLEALHWVSFLLGQVQAQV